jgi:predicted transglutaminase-like cysteine proteinase
MPSKRSTGDKTVLGGDFWLVRGVRKMRRIASLSNIPGWVGVLLAGALYMAEPLPCSAAPILAVEYVKAGWPGEHDANQATAHRDYDASNGEEATRLFDVSTEPVAMGELHEKWLRMIAAMARDLAVVAQCHSEVPCPVAAQRLIGISAKGAWRNGRARVGLVNRAANLAIRPVSDERQWGVADHWSDPFETLLSYRGDCEDYAILKYAALLEAGVPTSDLKIVILKNLFPNEYHAVVAARVDGEWLILDNRTLTLVRDRDLRRAIPMFVLDRQGVRRLKWESRDWQAATRLSSSSG